MPNIPAIPQAFFDEFGKSADDRVMDYGHACYAAALSQTAGVVEGWVLVPAEPTAKMQVAGWCAHWEDTKPRDVWAAMLGALPSPYVSPMPNNPELVNPSLDDAWKNIITSYGLDPINRDVAAVTHALAKIAAAPAASGGERGTCSRHCAETGQCTNTCAPIEASASQSSNPNPVTPGLSSESGASVSERGE